MKSKLFKSTLLAGMFALAAGLLARPALAVDVVALGYAEAAYKGATHLVVVKYTDFTETSTNTAQTLGASFPVAAKLGVEVVYCKLKTAFDTGNTNYTGSCAITVGDGGDPDRFLASQELASDGTEVFLKYGTGTQLAYTTADFVDFVFTPNAEEALAANTSGEVWIYLKVIDGR